ncbi:MAG TPA: hypothetical protein VNB22_11360 [Pyrinomonadaceae bacterium]|nr:hypothetical protein [Pyrinomonadaceae bacterium]
MKFLLLIVPVILSLQVIGYAQTDFNPKSEIVGSQEKTVKGAPFSADAISESVQLMFDGNKIVRTVKSSLFRDGEGRFRREEMPKPVGIGTFVETPKTVSIFDPVAGFRFYLNSNSKTVRQEEVKNKRFLFEREKRQEENIKRQEENIKRQEKIAKQREAIEKQKENINSNSNSNSNSNDDDREKIKPSVNKTPPGVKQPEKPQTPTIPKIPNAPSMSVLTKGEVKTESLGTRKIEGIEAEGIRSTKTIPAGEIGNERSFEIVYERWFSKDLQLIVFSKYTDPRFGEQTYQLTNIKRSEPDAELFKVPADYKIVDKSFEYKPKQSPEKKKPE